MKLLHRSVWSTTLVALASATGFYAQVGSINSAVIMNHVFNDMPASTSASVNGYPGSVTLSESGVSRSASGGLERDAWYFSNNGSTPYQFQANDYFTASFGVTLTGGASGVDIEAGFLFSNPSGNFGGDSQMIVSGTGVVAQFGGPSYYPFSPAAGGYPGKGGSVANYTEGSTYTMTMAYVLDPNTGMNAFEYWVNGQQAASAPGNPYFDLGAGQTLGSPGDSLGGYFQIGNGGPNQAGTAVFSNISIQSVPEPSVIALLGVSIAALPKLGCAVAKLN